MSPRSTSRIVHGNRIERLLDTLSSTLTQAREESLGPPRHTIVVQGRGMATWLNMELCRRHGVWANTEYLYPRHLVTRVFATLLPEGATAHGPERIFWTLASHLPAWLEEPEFAPLAAYLADDAHGQKRFQLCERLTTTFDEYLTFRPELLLGWEQDEPARRRRGRPETDAFAPQLSLFAPTATSSHEAWQRALWRRLRPLLGDAHPALREARLRASLETPGWTLPERLSVFGLSSLPPLFARTFAAMARHCPVDFYLLSAASVEVPQGRNRLLASSGVLGSDFRTLLTTTCQASGARLASEPTYLEPPDTSLLGQLQRDLLHDTESELLRRSGDRSVACHSCHGPTREIEVLHDQLLEWIHVEGYQPHEIAVMAPDIDDYAPLIEAVFERSVGDTLFVPYRISDRRPQGENAVFDGWLAVLGLARARVSSAEVLDLLARPPVHEHFGISASDLSTLRTWVTDSGTRWGMDAKHRARFGVPEDHTNTWRFALDRLLLGYAVPTRGRELVLGTMPYDEIEGKGGELLGRFAHFLETLFEHLDTLSEARSLPEWQAALGRMSTDLFAQTEDNAWQHQAILSASAELSEHAAAAGFSDTLELEVVQKLVAGHFDQRRSAHGFLSGGVTFCAMTPMRSIPFRAVWLLGLNDGDFPRTTQRPDFSLLDPAGNDRRPGDPNRRLDDRYLFLECLLSARDRFVVSYAGQSIRDNAKLPPAVVVSELLEQVTERAVDERGRRLAPDDLVLEHPLQPFSPRYFGATSDERPGGELFSYEHGYLGGARSLLKDRQQAVPLFDRALAPVTDTTLALDDVLAFFSAPTEFLLERRLLLDLRDRDIDVPEREPAILDGLALYQVGEVALEHRLLGIPKERTGELLRARGLLPAGAGGDFEFERALRSATPIAQRALSFCSVRVHERFPFELELEAGARLRGELGDIWSNGLLQVQFARLGARHQLQAWIRHLVLCACRPAHTKPSTWLIGRQEKQDGAAHYAYDAVSEPLALLGGLLRYFRSGQERPLLLFPETSLAHVDGGRSENEWRTELQRSPGLRRVYGANTTLTEHGPQGHESREPSFALVAEDVFGPLLAHRRKVD